MSRRRQASKSADDLARALQFVGYEIRMLVGALSFDPLKIEWRTGPAAGLEALAVQNMPVEVRVLHVRNVSEFLGGFARPKPDSLRAKDYLPAFSAREQRKLEAVWRRASRELAHLTTRRVTDEEHADGARSKEWLYSDFAPALKASLAFVDDLLQSKWLAGGSPHRDQFLEAKDGLIRLVAFVESGHAVAEGPQS